MDHIVFVILRRMRQPLMTLLIVYSVSILGLVLIPGKNPDGSTWYMDFFHAIYFVSYMATTIGFGEIPQAFSAAQRMWVILSLYAGVTAWLYAFGTILTLVQDKTFQQSLDEHKLARHIRTMREPFVLICGYGETGSALVQGLTDIGRHVAVVEIDEARINLLKIEVLLDYVPSLHGDARKPLHLQEAGLQHPMCQAVVAVTNENEANLKIAITSKLLNPDIKVICRADSHEVERNMASFGTNYIIDPYDTFATSLAIAFQVPCLFLLKTWLYSIRGIELEEPVYPPTHGHWVICGYGRFGKAVYERLIRENLKVVVIEANPGITGKPENDFVLGRGTEADTLLQADIERASGLIAGTDNDANNLSIVVTARELNQNLFTIIRQNHLDNNAIMEAVKADIVMHPSKIIADKIRILLGTPMLHRFVSLAYYQDNEWACELISRISVIIGSQAPQVEEIQLNEPCGHAVLFYLQQGQTVTLEDILRDPWQREQELPCIILMLERGNDNKDSLLLPEPTVELHEGDRLLICSGSQEFNRIYWNLQQENVLNYSRTGKTRNQSWLWKKLGKS